MTATSVFLLMLFATGGFLLACGILVHLAERIAEPLRHMVLILGALAEVDKDTRRPPRAEDLRQQAKYN